MPLAQPGCFAYIARSFGKKIYFMRRPKGIKTKKSVSKRFKITAGGKVLRHRAGRRHLCQIRINAAARAAGITYSRFIEGLKAAKCALDRKVLADLAATDAAAFGELVRIAQDALKTKGVKA